MKKLLLFLFCALLLLSPAACSAGETAENITATPTATPTAAPTTTLTPTATPAPAESSGPVEYVEIYSAAMWNEFARSYNSEREKYAGCVTVEITLTLDFKNVDFVPLADGFSGKISGIDAVLSAEEWQERIDTKKKWPLDYSGTFMNISAIEGVNGEAASSLFGSVGELTLENVSFANIYLDEAKCLIAESADTLTLRNVSVENCMLPDGRSILAENAGEISVSEFVAESCVLTGYEYMAGLVTFVSGNAEFEDVFICRSSFELSPDNGGSGLWGAGIGLLAKSIDGAVSFENIDIYACRTTGLYTQALSCSAGSISKCSNILLDSCSFINYQIEGRYPSGIMVSCGGESFMEMPVLEENVAITNCLISGGYAEEDFTARGYRVENCVFIKDPPQ